MKIITLKKIDLDEAIHSALEALHAGNLVIYPTETSYGIAADATNPVAIENLRAYKGNRQNKPFSIIVASKNMAENYVSLTPLAEELYENYLPGALTVISHGIENSVAPGVMSENGSIGVRIPDNEVVLELVSQFGKPITATSANPSDEKQPYTIADITEVLSTKQENLVAIALDAGQLAPTLPTTIVDARGQRLKVLRQGELQFDEKELITSDSPEQTIELGETLIKKYKSFWGNTPLIFALSGEMGTGKTHFTKGIASGLGITELIKSPSYALVHEHEFTLHGKQLPFLHVDAWRLEQSSDIETLGIEDTLQKNGIVAIEWANQGNSLLEQWKKTAVIVFIHFSVQENEIDKLTRSIRVETIL